MELGAFVRPKYQVSMAKFLTEDFDPVRQAVEDQDWEAFERPLRPHGRAGELLPRRLRQGLHPVEAAGHAPARPRPDAPGRDPRATPGAGRRSTAGDGAGIGHPGRAMGATPAGSEPTSPDHLDLLRVVLRAAEAASAPSTLEEAAAVVLSDLCQLAGWPVGHLYVAGGPGTLVPTATWYLADPERFRVLRQVAQAMAVAAGPAAACPGGCWPAGGRRRATTWARPRPRPGWSPPSAVPVVCGSEVVALLHLLGAEGRRRRPGAPSACSTRPWPPPTSSAGSSTGGGRRRPRTAAGGWWRRPTTPSSASTHGRRHRRVERPGRGHVRVDPGRGARPAPERGRDPRPVPGRPRGGLPPGAGRGRRARRLQAGAGRGAPVGQPSSRWRSPSGGRTTTSGGWSTGSSATSASGAGSRCSWPARPSTTASPACPTGCCSGTGWRTPWPAPSATGPPSPC